jgi:hypothetical protein
MNTDTWLTILTAVLGFLSVAVGLILRWILANKDNIVALIKAIRDIHAIITAAPSLPNPAPLPPAIQPGGVK